MAICQSIHNFVHNFSLKYCKTLIIRVTLFSRRHQQRFIHKTLFSRFVISSYLILIIEIIGEDFIFASPMLSRIYAKIKSSRIRSKVTWILLIRESVGHSSVTRTLTWAEVRSINGRVFIFGVHDPCESLPMVICLDLDYVLGQFCCLSEWIKSIADVLKRRIRRLKHSVNTRHESIFSDPNVTREISRLHENFVTVPADKASNNYTFVCKRHYVSTLSEELGLYSLPGNPTYNLTDFSESEVLDNHKSVLTSFGIETSNDELDMPYLHWIPKMHKNPYKHRFVAGLSKGSTKPLSILLTKLLTHIKQGL